MTPASVLLTTERILGLQPPVAYGLAAAVLVVAVVIAALLGRRSGRRALAQRLSALGSRLGLDPPTTDANLEMAVTYLEQVTGSAAEAVAESSADAIRLRRALDTMPQGVVICDDQGTSVYRNRPANALVTGRRADALAAQAVTELLDVGLHDGGGERTLELYGPPRRTLHLRVRQIDDGRRPLGVIGVIEDVSERRRLDEIRRDFVANVSHELKTPIGALGLLAETLVAEPDTEVAHRLAGRIHTEAFRVSRIIDDLLDLSRIESAEAPPREAVPVNLVMAEAVERVRSAADQRGIEIVLHEAAAAPAVVGDRRQLVSAMHALLENAVNYSYDDSKIDITGRIEGAMALSGEDPHHVGDLEDGDSGADAGAGSISDRTLGVLGSAAGGSLGAGLRTSTVESGSLSTAGSISVAPAADAAEMSESAGDQSPAGPTVCISVTDRGIGIPARDLDRIFERFYRVDHGRSRGTGGTGLGLSIVRHVASNHRGRVDVESREGEGSTFTLVLPLGQSRS